MLLKYLYMQYQSLRLVSTLFLLAYHYTLTLDISAVRHKHPYATSGLIDFSVYYGFPRVFVRHQNKSFKTLFALTTN